MNTNVADFLTARQRLFCDEYLIDRNATRAALRAGYTGGTALNGQLMALPKVKLYLQQRMDDVSARLQVDHERILNELAKIAFASIGSFFRKDGGMKDVNQISEDDKAALLSIRTGKADSEGRAYVNGFKMYNKLSALDKMAKHTNFYKPEQKEKVVYVYLDKADLELDLEDDLMGDCTDLMGDCTDLKKDPTDLRMFDSPDLKVAVADDDEVGYDNTKYEEGNYPEGVLVYADYVKQQAAEREKNGVAAFKDYSAFTCDADGVVCTEDDEDEEFDGVFRDGAGIPYDPELAKAEMLMRMEQECVRV